VLSPLRVQALKEFRQKAVSIMNKIPNRYYPFVVFIVIGIIGVVLSWLLQGSICLFIRVVGIPSPACGMTRAHLMLFNLDIVGAFRFHPLFWMPLAICILAFFKKLNNKVIFTFIVLLIGVWILRMIFLFPDQIPPMEYNENGILPTVFRFFRGFFH